MKKKQCLLFLFFIFLMLKGGNYTLSAQSVYEGQRNTKNAILQLNRYVEEAKKVDNQEKQNELATFRQKFSKEWYSNYHLNKHLNAVSCLGDLNEKGQFKALIAKEEELGEKIWTWNWGYIKATAPLLTDAWQRIWRIADAYKSKKITLTEDNWSRYLKAIAYYGAMESCRPNSSGRFLDSCFGIAEAAVFTYFCLLPEMDAVEKEVKTDALWLNAHEKLLVIGFQSWTQPFREDATDQNVVQVARFQHHVWWVGANGITYRPVLAAAAMMNSIPMMDVLSEVCIKAISWTSQQTLDEAFWSEGFTADGAGWGHGTQCLIWGYPVQGITAAVSLLTRMKGSSWGDSFSEKNKAALLNFFRGGNWYFYKGHIPLGLDRKTMLPSLANKRKIPYLNLLKDVCANWIDTFNEEEKAELLKLKSEADRTYIYMSKQPTGDYNGSRYFFNNDDLIKKDTRSYISVNMASRRTSGLESDKDNSDRYNFFMGDGMTLFMKSGDEYKKIYGAMDVTALPGITAREGMDQLTPVTNWSGYCSKHNFAGGATLGGANAVGGFIFEKMNKSTGSSMDKDNPSIYRVKAYKSYFFFDKYMIALGAGVQNLNSTLSGTIRTTIEQTAKSDLLVNKEGTDETPDELVNQSFLTEDGTPYWIRQRGKFCYTILPEYSKNAYWTVETKRTNWKEISALNKNATESDVTVFRAWIDHGKKPMGETATYGYVVYAGSTTPSKELPFKVIRNDQSIQAMQSKDGTVVEAVFYKKDSVLRLNDLTIAPSIPSVLLMEKKEDGWHFAMTDATMDKNVKMATVTFNGNEEKQVTMPQGDLCGKPAVFDYMITADRQVEDKFEIYASINNSIVINGLEHASVSIYSLNGVCLDQFVVKNKMTVYTNDQFAEGGLFLIKVVRGNQCFSRKLFVHK